ncbi:hypothetical protein L218DRAFT_999419 [Marasmius fiardii PR-910]|nr:hypothetical protein L218DRAFT_999419 [Marasmius fiardii PR-910]
MNAINANALQQRQVLGGILTDIFSGAETVVSQVGSGLTSAIGGVTSAGGVLTSILPPPTSTGPTTRQSVSTTPTLSSIFSIPSAGRSSTSQFSFSLPTSSSSSSSSSSSVPLSPSISLVETTSNGVKQTVTAFVTHSASSTPTTAPVTNKSFLQNKPLSGFVFALCGIVGVVLIILTATFAMRRRRRMKLENEAISYDPSIGRGSYHDDMETRLVNEKASSEHGTTFGSAGVYGTTYAPKPDGMYYDQGHYPAYGQQYPNYASPNPPFDQQQAYGGIGTNYNVGVGASVPPLAYDPERYSSELYRSLSRGSDNSASSPPPAPPAKPRVPASLMNGGVAIKSPPPAAVRPPTPPQLPRAFGDNGSIDERQVVSPIDLKVANQ